LFLLIFFSDRIKNFTNTAELSIKLLRLRCIPSVTAKALLISFLAEMFTGVSSVQTSAIDLKLRNNVQNGVNSIRVSTFLKI